MRKGKENCVCSRDCVCVCVGHVCLKARQLEKPSLTPLWLLALTKNATQLEKTNVIFYFSVCLSDWMGSPFERVVCGDFNGKYRETIDQMTLRQMGYPWNMKYEKYYEKKTAVLLAFFFFLTSLRPWKGASTCLRTLLSRSGVQRIRHMAHSCWLLRPVINSTAAAAAFSLLLRSFVCLLKSFSWQRQWGKQTSG